MIFGKIDFINILPFHIFLKKSALQNSFKKSIEHKKGVPSRQNFLLKRRKVDGAIISSVESCNKMYKKIDLGIVAKKEVKSVIVKRGESKNDPASATSNALAKVLKIQGEVIIGDRALKLYLKEPESYVDLAKQWSQKHQLPFVFARFCVNKNAPFFKKLSKQFLSKKVKIPRYILDKYAHERGIKQEDILEYLKLLSYELNSKEKLSLKRFLSLAKKGWLIYNQS